MSEWIVYGKDGLTEKCRVKNLQYEGEFMGACSLTVNISSPSPVNFELGDYMEYRGERFEINYDPSVVKQSAIETDGEGFVYESVVFNSLSDELTRCDFLDYVAYDNELHYSSLPNFSFFADNISKLAERIQVNLDRIYTGSKKWTVNVHPEYVNTLNVNIQANNNTVWDALGFVNSKFGANFIIRGRTITIGTTGVAVGNVFSYGKGNGLYKIERNAESSQKIITRLRAYGSTRNMPTDYYKNVEGGDVPNNMAVKNLMLPSFPVNTHDPYIDSDNIDELGIREGTVFFDGSGDLEEIYPTMEGMTAEDLAEAGITVNATGALDEVLSAEQITDNGVFEPAEGEETVTIPTFTITLKDVGFDINDYLTTSSATISMKDGMCGGRDFEIVSCEKSGSNYVLTCNRHYDESLDLYFPYNDYQIKGGDKFVLLNIEMPDVYIKAASERLLKAAKAYLTKNDYVRYSYTLTVDNVFMARQHDEAVKNGGKSIHDTIKEGDLIIFEDEDLGINGSVTISSLSIKEDMEGSLIPEYEITLKDEKTVGSIEKIQNQITSILAGGIGSGTELNTEQLRSLIELYGSKIFLRKDKDDRTPFKLNVGDKLTAEKGIQIGKSFIPGILTGSGGFFDEYANGEVESLIIRRFLEVPDLYFNRVEIKLGDDWNAPGRGLFESVVPDTDNPMTGTGYLKLEEKEYGAIAVGDICMGIFHSNISSENATEDSDDSRGNFQFAGFYTCYFTITEITGEDNKQFRYQLRPVSDRWKLTFHPSPSMKFVSYGSFTRKDRQTSVYTTRTYTRLLKNQNTWEISADNIAMQYGDLANMSVHGIDMTGYSVYLNNIYMTGVFKQVKPDGTPVQTVNDRGAWVSGTEYVFYDRVSHNGSLWLCVNESGTNTEPTKTNSDWLLQVASGDSLVAGGRFSSANTPYSPNSVVDFAEKAWVSTDTVDYAPYSIWTDASGNRFQFNDGGFCLVDEEMRDGWKVLLDTSGLKDGQDGKSFYAQFSNDGVNWHDTFTEGDIYMRQKVGEDAAWSDAIRIVGEAGAAGVNGEYTEYEFAVNESLDTAPTSGWQDAPPTIGRGQYLWMRMRVVQGDGTVGNWSTPVRLKGEQGDNVEFIGHFATGSEIPFLGVVSMGNSNWVAKVKTINPPLWCWTDASGNRFTYSDGGFCLTGEENTEEYELMVSNGKDGADGTDYEFIFYNTTEEIRPSTPETKQVDDYIPSGWHDDAVGVSESVQYEWMSMRRKKDGLWGKYSTPALWAKFGEDGTNYEFVYTRTKTVSRPTTPSTKQQDDYVPTGWTDDPVGTDEEYVYEWMSKRRKVGSVWGEFSAPALWSSYSILSFKATAFIRTNDTPSTPTGGSYDSPVPTSTPKWYDGIPSGEEILWASTRVFTKNGTGIQDSSWSTPRQMTDTSSFEVVYHASETEPTPPTNYPTTTGAWSPNNGWTDDPSESSVWMATATKANGVWGAWKVSKIKGEKGEDGNYYEYVYLLTRTSAPPDTPVSENMDAWTPQGGWTSLPSGVTDVYRYEWVSQRQKANGTWGNYSTPTIWAMFGEGKQGIQGCVIRDSEWAEGVEYRNDEDLTGGTRYIDVVLVRDENAATGWVAYKCIQTHTSTYQTKPYHSLYWEEFGTNTTAIFTSLILAKNAKITFLQGNQLLVQKDDGTITAGLSGSEEGQKVRFWAGAETPDDAPFRVTEDGTMIAEDATIKGVIRNPWKQLVYKLIYSSSSGDAYGYDGSAIDNDKVSISPILRCELKIGWGDLADGRDVAIRVNNTSNSHIFIKVPTGYYAIDHEEKKVNAGSELILNVGYIYYLTGCSDCWVVNKRVKITG